MERRKKRWFLGCGGLFLILLGVLALLVWPMVSARRKPKPVVQVVTYYPGMPASSIEKTISNRIERWCIQADGAEHVTSRSLNGVSIVRISFRNDIDYGKAVERIVQLASDALPTMSPEILPPFILTSSPLSSDPLGMLALTSSTVDETTLRGLADDQIGTWFRLVPGAMLPVVVQGGKEATFVIDFDPKKLASHKLALKDIATLLKEQYGRDLVATVLDNSLSIDGRLQKLKIDQLKEVLVFVGDGKFVHLRDIGVVRAVPIAPPARLRIDGQPAVGVSVYPKSDASPKDVRAEITRELPSLPSKLPREVQLRWVPLRAEHKWLRERDDGLLKLFVRAPSSSRLAETEKRVAAVESFLEKRIPAKEREAILSQLGVEPDFPAIFTVNAGPMDATIFVQLSRDRTLSAADYAAKLRRELQDDPQLADLSLRFVSRDMPVPLDIRIAGGTLAEMTRVAKAIRSQLATIKGTVDVDIAQRMDEPFLVIKADAEKAAAVGLSSQEVLKQYVAALQAPAASDRDFWIDRTGDGDSIAIPFSTELKLEEALQKEAIGKNLKQPIKLSSLTTVQRTISAVEIDHVSLQRVLDVRANIEERKRSEVIADILKMIQELSVPKGMKVELVDAK